MKKISLNSKPTSEPENGLAIDESLIPHQETDTVDSPTIETTSRRTSSRPQKGSMKKQKMQPILIAAVVLAIAAGIGTGYGVHQLNAKGTNGELNESEIQAGSPTDQIKVGDIYGSKEEANFKDSAEGVIVEGGLEGEGSHHLVRPGGDSQNVYMTSSVVDLSEFEGTKVKVWGETYSAQKAGWLMDVGRIKVLELDAELPEE